MPLTMVVGSWHASDLACVYMYACLVGSNTISYVVGVVTILWYPKASKSCLQLATISATQLLCTGPCTIRYYVILGALKAQGYQLTDSLTYSSSPI